MSKWNKHEWERSIKEEPYPSTNEEWIRLLFRAGLTADDIADTSFEEKHAIVIGYLEGLQDQRELAQFRRLETPASVCHKSEDSVPTHNLSCLLKVDGQIVLDHRLQRIGNPLYWDVEKTETATIVTIFHS